MDLFEIGDSLLTRAQDLMLTAAVVVVVAFIILMSWKARFAWAAMVLAAAAGMFVLWLVNNIDEVGENVVDDTVIGNAAD